MGVAHAKEKYDHKLPPFVKRIPTEPPGFTTPIAVEKVHINGIGRTNEEFIKPIIQHLFNAKTFRELVRQSHYVHSRLLELECFKEIDILIDTSNGPKSLSNGYELTLNVIEYGKRVGRIEASTGNNEAGAMISLGLPNMYGKGEKISTEFNYSNKHTSNLSMRFSKPLVTSFSTSFAKASAYQLHHFWIESGYSNLERGTYLEFLTYSSPRVSHHLQWNAAWRALQCLNKTVPFSIREDSGHSLKSSLSHTLRVDKRDKIIFPTRGYLFEMTNEVAGPFGGDIGLIKNEMKLEKNISLAKDFVFQATLHGGAVCEFAKKRMLICDKFFLGGPTSIRGFNLRGAGPHEDRCALGAEAYWAAGAHLYAPLPFRIFDKSFGERMRSHFFFNFGNLEQLNSEHDYKEIFWNMINATRASCGLGISFTFNNAILELNYSIPISKQPGDKANRGFQFGLGVNFL